jgi:5-methylcytosine-specific restriction endonuclease McrA
MSPGRGAFRAKKRTTKFRNWSKLEYIKNGGRCPLCGQIMTMPGIKYTGKKNMATADHIVPLDDGGNNSYENLRLICFRCNTRLDHSRLQRISSLARNAKLKMEAQTH